MRRSIFPVLCFVLLAIAIGGVSTVWTHGANTLAIQY